MPSRNLEETIHRAIEHASERRQEFVTLEHLLLALTEDPDAAALLKDCGVSLDALQRELRNYLDRHQDYLVVDPVSDLRRSTAFNDVLARAVSVISEEDSGEAGNTVTGVHVLAAVFSERESFALFFLKEMGLGEAAVVEYLRGIEGNGAT